MRLGYGGESRQQGRFRERLHPCTRRYDEFVHRLGRELVILTKKNLGVHGVTP